MKRHFRASIAGLVLIAVIAAPAQAQFGSSIVFDPTNYSQNVLTAARELQQVNNELQSLENQATSLVNQARNLASLPYSSLSSLDQSILQTEQLLTQAQRIAYNVSTIDQAFTQTYPAFYPASTSSQQLIEDKIVVESDYGYFRLHDKISEAAKDGLRRWVARRAIKAAQRLSDYLQQLIISYRSLFQVLERISATV